MLKKVINLGILLIMVFLGCLAQKNQTNQLNPIKADDLMQGITPASVGVVNLDKPFIDGVANFSVELFKNSFSSKENSLISPTSVLLALAMTTNGARSTTLSQMEAVIGGGLSIQELNKYLYSYVKKLPSEDKSILNIANSIWFRDKGFDVKQDFLQTNADYYGAAAYKSAFDNGTVKDINNWVKKNTDGLIDSIIDDISSDAIMYLINTVLFDAEWYEKYETSAVRDRQFTAFDGTKQTVKFMHSNEYRYLESDSAKGFIRPYFDNKYSFVALLPDENISINEYVASLTGGTFMNIVNNAWGTRVIAALPKFEYDYEITMNGALQTMGMTDAFCPIAADLSNIGTAWGNLFISEVKHKTFITVDERGTKAAAVTSVGVDVTSVQPQPKIVTLDRPFVYAIIDNETKLPIFIGTIMALK